jgi:hypothetical protein
MEAEGPTLHWLESRLNAREALQAGETLFAAVKEAVYLFEAPSDTDDELPARE